MYIILQMQHRQCILFEKWVQGWSGWNLIMNYNQVAVRLNVNVELCPEHVPINGCNITIFNRILMKKMKNRTHFHNGLLYYKSGKVQLSSSGKWNNILVYFRRVNIIHTTSFLPMITINKEWPFPAVGHGHVDLMNIICPSKSWGKETWHCLCQIVNNSIHVVLHHTCSYSTNLILVIVHT